MSSSDSVPESGHRARKLVIPLDDASSDIEQILKGLASGPRIEILRYLGAHAGSVSEIAEALGMPASTAALHVKQLEKAGLIRTELKPASRGLQKICARLFDQVVITLPTGELSQENVQDTAMPIGAYVDCQVVPTCGLVSEHGIIGNLDDPNTFYYPERIHAQLIWFKSGYVEYRFPKSLPKRSEIDSLQISFEACSEAPLHNADWPSDIFLAINGVEVGTWTSPGDFGGERGALTPDWWEEWNSQYGLLKVWKVTQAGSYVDGIEVSSVTLRDLRLDEFPWITVRIGVKDDAVNVGGLNIFGRCFGNYPQDILMRLRFRARA